MQDWQQRVIDEKLDVTAKLVAVVSSLGDAEFVDSLSDNQLAELMRQAEVMLEYQRILILRTQSFDD
jgi:hypothetical protein